jgi:hypothetical protein
MADMSISRAWDETTSFVGRHGGTLFTVAFALIALPSVVFQALGPAQGSPGEVPNPGLWLLLLPVVLVLTIAGTVAISALAMGRETVIGSAIAHGFRRTLPLLGATLLLGLGLIVVLVPVVAILGLDIAALVEGRAATAGVVGRFFLALLVVMAVFLFFWVRLMLMTPVAAAERGGPIAIMRRSWQLTAGRFWKLLGFVLLFFLAALVVMLVVTLILGLVIALVAGPPETSSVGRLLMLLIGGVLNAVFVVFFTTAVARLYLQLSGGDPSAVFRDE